MQGAITVTARDAVPPAGVYRSTPCTRSPSSASSERVSESERTVLGDLAIRHVTRRVPFRVVIRGMTVDQRGQSKLAASATTDLARPDFDFTTELEMESGTEGGCDVWVRVEIEAILQEGDAR